MRRSVILAVSMLAAVAAFAQAPPNSNQDVAVKKTKEGPGPKSSGEAQAVQAVLQAQVPDDAIKAVDNLITKYPDTDFKSFALEREGEAYQQKNDNNKAMVFAEQALQADPKNFDADNLLANVLATITKENSLQSVKDENLTKADKYAHDALDALNGEKPWLYQEAQWVKVKAMATGQAYQALGNAALVRKKNDEAIADFQKGVDASSDPLITIRLARALAASKKYDEAMNWDDKVINAADTPAQFKSIAKSDKGRFELMAKSK